jgi:hypothetical protein
MRNLDGASKPEQTHTNHMSETKNTFQQSLVPVPKTLGRATGYQIAELMDALSCVRLCCLFALSPHGEELPVHWQKRIDAIPSGKHSLAQMCKAMNLWRKWTYPHQTLTPLQVQQFLGALEK